MFELIQAAEHTYWFQSPAKVGLVKLNDTEVCLIDSGNDKDAGKKILRQLDANGWKLKAIYNTHSHADHIGGNRFLQDRTGCRVFAPGTEQALTAFPVLEPVSLYGGYPPKELRHKFLMAQESRAELLTEDALPEGLTAIPMPGHSFDMVGYRTCDDVVFLADCLSSRETLAKYPIGYLYDVKQYLETLEAVKMLKAKLFVPSHCEPTEDIAPLADENIRKTQEIADVLVNLCHEPIGFDDLLARVFDVFGMTITFEQHALVGSTVRSYLAWLKELGRMQMLLEGNRLLWEKA